jgi:predicted nucleic acid-binding protein
VAAGVVLVDTGPLVALFDPSDAARAPCLECLEALEADDLVTTEAVVTEAVFLLSFSTKAQGALLRLLASGRPRVESLTAEERLRAGELIERYADLPMDYADATLVVLAERLRATRIFTLDWRDFSVYRVRRGGFQVIPSPRQVPSRTRRRPHRHHLH